VRHLGGFISFEKLCIKIISMDTVVLFFILGAIALVTLLILYSKGKVTGSFMISGLVVIMFIFSFITGR
jgi:hypothetical protein